MIKQFLAALAVLAVFTLPASADIISPGEQGISIANYIENIDGFPDYRFISAGRMGPDFGGGTCDIYFVSEDGLIPQQYKFCTTSVFAVPKAAINVSDPRLAPWGMGGAEFSAFLASSGAKEVAQGIRTYKTVFSLSTEESVTNYYNVDLGRTLESPTRTVIGYSALLYVYIVLPIAALAGIVAILARRKRT